MFRELNKNYDNFGPDAEFEALFDNEELAADYIERNRDNYLDFKDRFATQLGGNPTNQQVIEKLEKKVGSNIYPFETFYSFDGWDTSKLKPVKMMGMSIHPGRDRVRNFRKHLADIFIFENAVENIASLYGEEFVSEHRTNYTVIGPRKDGGTHFKYGGYHLLCLDEGMEYIDDAGKPIETERAKNEALAIHEYWHLLISRMLKLPVFTIEVADSNRPFNASAENAVEEAVCMWEQLEYLKKTSPSDYSSLVLDRQLHVAWMHEQSWNGKTDFRADREARYAIGMDLIEILSKNGWKPGNLNGIIAEVSAFVTSMGIRTLYDIPIDYNEEKFNQFMDWIKELKS